MTNHYAWQARWSVLTTVLISMLYYAVWEAQFSWMPNRISWFFLFAAFLNFLWSLKVADSAIKLKTKRGSDVLENMLFAICLATLLLVFCTLIVLYQWGGSI